MSPPESVGAGVVCGGADPTPVYAGAWLVVLAVGLAGGAGAGATDDAGAGFGPKLLGGVRSGPELVGALGADPPGGAMTHRPHRAEKARALGPPGERRRLPGRRIGRRSFD